MQNLWRLQITWNDQVSEPLLTRWQKLYAKLPYLNNVVIARWTGAEAGSQLELHGFVDASTHAYATVVYLKTITPTGDVIISLLENQK